MSATDNRVLYALKTDGLVFPKASSHAKNQPCALEAGFVELLPCAQTCFQSLVILNLVQLPVLIHSTL